MTTSTYPDDLLYTQDHEWARVEEANGEKLVTVGVTSFAVEQLGDVTHVDLPRESQHVKRGEVFGSVESVKAVSDLFAPLSGRIVKVNSALVSSPETVNEDPYSQGWMIQVAPASPDDLNHLMSAEPLTSGNNEAWPR